MDDTHVETDVLPDSKWDEDNQQVIVLTRDVQGDTYLLRVAHKKTPRDCCH